MDSQQQLCTVETGIARRPGREQRPFPLTRPAEVKAAPSRPMGASGWQVAAKHLIDCTVAAVALLVLAPLLLALALAVRLSSPGPAVFRQRRVGRDGDEFDLLKFRSMRIDRDQPKFAPGAGLAPGGIEGTDRRTRVGRLLRASSLDELPQLVNVLRGEMSLVGPRPERPEFVERFSREIPGYGDRHRVRAGITGWAQAHGLRGQTSIEERVAFDNYYIDNWSVRLELWTLAKTVIEVLGLGHGPNQAQPVDELPEAQPVLELHLAQAVREVSAVTAADASLQRSLSSVTESAMPLAA